MATLSPSLRNVFREIDARWPNRDRRTDGWLRWPWQGRSIGHNPDSRGIVHAIDVDRDGIDPDLIVRKIYKGDRVLWYMIWNRTLYSNTYGWRPVRYTGANPHTDHIHIEVYQTAHAENYGGGWNIAGSGIGEAIGEAAGQLGGIAPSNWDWRNSVWASSDEFNTLAVYTDGYGRLVRQIRE